MRTLTSVAVVSIVILVVAFAGRVCAAPPLPFHTIEGVGGGAITPMAYLVNPEPQGAFFGKPAAAFSYVNIGRKNLDAFTVTETLNGRIELGYAANRLGLGNLPAAIRDATGVNIDRGDVWLHHLNVRLLLVEENTCLGGLAMPAITGGFHFKINEGIRDIDRRLGGALALIGYNRSNSVDYTLTMTKTIPPEILGRPLILTAGLRESQGSQLGLLGFGSHYQTTFEGNIVYLPTDWLVLAYEYRQKPDPYARIPGLIGDEDNWQGFDVAFILNDHTTFVGGYALFGTVANAEEDSVWWMQFKYEF